MATSGYWYSGYTTTSSTARTATRTRKKRLIEVDKGSPSNTRYCIFYAVDEDPVIFCKNYKVMKRELTKLRNRSDVKQKSIRVFRQVDI